MSATKTAKRILSVKVRREVDVDPDLSYLGQYSDRPGPDDVTIDREERGDRERGTYRYFIAAMSGEDTGNPDSVGQDYRRMEDYNADGWCMMGVWVEAQIVVAGVAQRVKSGGLWGIESDSGADYFREIGEEQLNELRGVLAELGFSKRAIGKAFADVDPAGDE